MVSFKHEHEGLEFITSANGKMQHMLAAAGMHACLRRNMQQH
jgi:hypothetical protein